MWDLKCFHTSDEKLTQLKSPQTWFSITTFAPLLDLSKYVVIVKKKKKRSNNHTLKMMVRHSRQGRQEGPESSSSSSSPRRPGWSSDHSRAKASVYTGRVWNDKPRKGDGITSKVRREKEKSWISFGTAIQLRTSGRGLSRQEGVRGPLRKERQRLEKRWGEKTFTKYCGAAVCRLSALENHEIFIATF